MKPLWIVGPCSIESEEFYRSSGTALREIMAGRDWYFKASFDKANRTATTGLRGPGLRAGLDVFKRFKKDFPEVKLLTDVHECNQVECLAAVVDCIQIPAFLCRQTDLLVECARFFNRINIKKGQWISPINILSAAEKVKQINPNAEVWLCERGTQLGYDRLIVDFRNVELFQSLFDRVVLDCTHSTQFITGDGRTSGDRKLAEKFLRSAPIFGYGGIFAEVHKNPKDALSDADCQIEMNRLPKLLEDFDQISAVCRG